ncbi:MAG: glutamine--fructose-6-phosphate aminotransferase, partial [Actinobacteria bacterium]|nr:glutamine--fructose-6-phosphate aminotransferase [Actinomycetota bacterium]
MCGIVGYIGPRPMGEILLPGLARLEYRGYDSAGLALHQGDKLTVSKRAGRIADLAEQLADLDTGGHLGIGHTRWATHGAPNGTNAHPHTDCTGDVAAVHNGIIENWAELKRELVGRGHEFTSDTDTEVVGHLIEEMADVPLDEAVRRVMQSAQGALALAV